MRITEIRSAGLRGATPEGGWSNELRPDDCVHTLIAVHTDAGLTGLGSVFANDALVRGALQVLEPLYRGETALEPERVERKASPAHVLAGTRRLDHAHHQRHRHRAVGSARAGDRPAGRAAARRTLSFARAPLRLAADGGAGGARRSSAGHQGAGVPRLQDRLGTVRPEERRARRSHRAGGPRCGRR